MTFQITEETNVSEIIENNFLSLAVLKKYGMFCYDCAARKNSNLKECANTHNVDLQNLIADLQKMMK